MVSSRNIEPNDPMWLDMIQADASATVFHHPAWMQLLSDCYGFRPFIFSILDNSSASNGNGQLRCKIRIGIPVADVNDHIKHRRWVALPFSDYCTPLYQNDESLYELADLLVAQYQKDHNPRIEIRASLPIQAQIQAQSPYVRHTVLLEADPGCVAKRAQRQQMQNVRTAEKNGIRVERGTGIDEVRAFYRLHCLTRRKHGVPVQPWRFFQLIAQHLLGAGLGFVLLAYKDDECISAGVFLHWGKTLTYKFSATDETCLNLRPNHLVTWKAMEWGCERGYTVFDFGRTDLADEGLRSYKRRWGAVEEPLTYVYIPTVPTALQRNRTLNNLMGDFIRRSPVWVCQAAGEVLYRYFG